MLILGNVSNLIKLNGFLLIYENEMKASRPPLKLDSHVFKLNFIRMIRQIFVWKNHQSKIRIKVCVKSVS